MCCEADWKREVVPDHKVSFLPRSASAPVVFWFCTKCIPLVVSGGAIERMRSKERSLSVEFDKGGLAAESADGIPLVRLHQCSRVSSIRLRHSTQVSTGSHNSASISAEREGHADGAQIHLEVRPRAKEFRNIWLGYLYRCDDDLLKSCGMTLFAYSLRIRTEYWVRRSGQTRSLGNAVRIAL